MEKRGRKDKKSEQKFEWLVRRRRRNQGLEFSESFRRINKQTENSAKFGQNWLCMSAGISKKAGWFIFQKNKAETGPKQHQKSGISCSLILPNCSLKCSVTSPVTSRMSLLLLKLLNKLLSLKYLVEETKSTGIQSVNYGIGKL